MPSNSNTSECSHTDIAIQTGGSGVGPRHDHHYEVQEEDFEETNVGDPRNPSPQFKMRIANTADMAISSLAIQVGGLPVAFTWNSALPLRAGGTVSGTADRLPLGLAVGNVYPVTITATLPDGTTETQTTSAIYTLGAGLGL
jgi:hypothetical protein